MSAGFIAALCVTALSLTAMILISRRGGHSWKSRLSSFFFLFVIMGSAAFMLYDAGIIGKKKIIRDFHVSEFETARAFILGKFISESYPGIGVIIVSGTDEIDKNLNDVRIASLKKGLGTGVKILATATLGTERDKKNGYLQYSGNVSSVDFDLLLSKHEGCGVIVSTLPFPKNFKKMKMFTYSESERVGLAVLYGNPYRDTAEVRDGKLLAFTCDRPMWTYSPNVPSDPKAAFDMRYLLVYSDNLDDIVKKNPNFIRRR
ncbi:MAG: hypothetical protein WC637_14450 [Victivallales bacterium]|jgi:hypothetical protein